MGGARIIGRGNKRDGMCDTIVNFKGNTAVIQQIACKSQRIYTGLGCVMNLDTKGDFMGRQRTSSVEWNVPAWQRNSRGLKEQTSDIAGLLNQVTETRLWSEGNDMSFFITCTG